MFFFLSPNMNLEGKYLIDTRERENIQNTILRWMVNKKEIENPIEINLEKS